MLLLSRPKPYKYESVIWYLMRVATRNRFKSINQLLNFLFPNKTGITEVDLFFGERSSFIKFLKESLGLNKQEIENILPDLWMPFSNKESSCVCKKCFFEKRTMDIFVHIKDCFICPLHNEPYYCFSVCNTPTDCMDQNIRLLTNTFQIKPKNYFVSSAIRRSIKKFRSRCFGEVSFENLNVLISRIRFVLIRFKQKVSFILKAKMFDFENQNLDYLLIIRPVSATRYINKKLIDCGISKDLSIELIYVYLACQLDYNLASRYLLLECQVLYNESPFPRITSTFSDVDNLDFIEFQTHQQKVLFSKIKLSILDIFLTEIFPEHDFSICHSELPFYKESKCFGLSDSLLNTNNSNKVVSFYEVVFLKKLIMNMSKNSM